MRAGVKGLAGGRDPEGRVKGGDKVRLGTWRSRGRTVAVSSEGGCGLFPLGTPQGSWDAPLGIVCPEDTRGQC